MNKTIFSRSLSALLAVLMVASCMVVIALPTTAAEAETPVYTAPEIVIKGEVDVWDKTTYTEPTQKDTDGYYLITSAAEMAWFFKYVTVDVTNNYRLATSVDLQGVDFGRDDNRVWSGDFDGNGYTISNFASTRGWSNGYFFNKVTGKIRNLNILNFRSKGDNATAGFINNLTGGTLSNVRMVCNVSNAKTLAGLVVSASGAGCVIENCIVSGTVSASGESGGAGGLVCWASETVSIRNCTNYATVKSTNSRGSKVGGIVANVSAGSVIENCTNYGNVLYDGSKMTGVYVGGIIGHAATKLSAITTIRNCVNFGAISNTHPSSGYAHGIVGIPSENIAGIIYLEDCINYGPVSAYTHAGGLISFSNKAVHATNCANYGTITCTGGEAGGLAAKIDGKNYASRPSALIAYNCANYGDVTGATYAGGFVGWLRGSSATDISGTQGFYVHGGLNVGTITGTTASAAGVAHMVKDGKLVVEVDNAFFNGVIAGSASDACTTLTIGSNVYADVAAGNVLGANNAGADTSAVLQYSATDMGDGTYCDALNAYVNSDSEDGANVLWYQSEAKMAPVHVTELKLTRATVMIAEQLFVVAQAQGILALPAGVELAVKDNEGNLTEGTLAADGTYQFVLKGVSLSTLAEEKQYTMMVGGVAAKGSYDFSILDLLATIYKQDTTPASEKVLIEKMVNYSYYAGHDDAFDNFNAAAGSNLAPSVAGVTEIADAGALEIKEGYEVALNVENGFAIVVMQEGVVVATHEKSVLNATDIINLGSAGEVSVAAMLNYYLVNSEKADVAAAAILLYQATIAARDGDVIN